MTALDPTSSIRPASGTPTRPLTLSVAYTPDSDDAFNFYAWEHGRVRMPNCAPRFDRSHISALNRAAEDGLYDVVAISSVVYPTLADRYWILAAGSSVGRGYGPVLVSKRFGSLEELAGRRVGVAGPLTTGGMLARMYCPLDAELVARPYNAIADEILAGDLDAGVMIHEELVHFPDLGLRRVCDLGDEWTRREGLPLPVGLNVAHKRLGLEAARAITRACQESLQWARRSPEEALAFAGRFGRGCASDFVPMFSNDDTHCMPDDVRRALGVLFERIADMGLVPRLGEYEVIDA